MQVNNAADGGLIVTKAIKDYKDGAGFVSIYSFQLVAFLSKHICPLYLRRYSIYFS